MNWMIELLLGQVPWEAFDFSISVLARSLAKRPLVRVHLNVNSSELFLLSWGPALGLVLSWWGVGGWIYPIVKRT